MEDITIRNCRSVWGTGEFDWAFKALEGDFNAIQDESERVGRNAIPDRRDINKFKEFIEESNLIDLQLVSKKFTYYRPNGSCKSKLDRVLVNEKWLNKWIDS
ncbi:hypothetical protein ACS0TY_007646 [Phlomoides rotata]